MASLEKETEIFNKLLPTLMKDEGKFALVIGVELKGVFSTYEDALKHGYEVAKLNPFLVKKISGTETVAYFSRDIDNVCHIAQS
jgi:hypothetical protein